MQIYVTGYFDPYNRSRTPSIIHDLRLAWIQAASYIGAKITFVEPAPYTTHGNLLTRLWQDIRYNVVRDGNPDQVYLISEIDFIPFYKGLKVVSALPPGDALFTSFVSRGKNLLLQDHWPLTGAWFLALNLAQVKTWPALGWLDAAGPRHDAANYARKNALDSGFLREENCSRLEFKDLREESPPFMGLELPGFGVHTFFSSRFDEPPDFELIPETGYTVSQHLGGIRRLLVSRASEISPGPSYS